ncbi:AMIN domain-containing protein [Pseudodesulfovibrio karagichevae]|uniref:AMIN domain-containing protein n=1 Tax=Pseudodesulfovibrio karagichevae TaxID=3239305 RepID=A0ABV4K2B7_9BACT
MSNTFRHRFLILAACAMAGLMAVALSARPARAQDQAPNGTRNEVRMDVDFTVLPKVLPDGSEAPASSAASSMPGEEPLPPEPDLPDATDAAPAQEPAPAQAQAQAPAAKATPAPEPAPVPEPAPAEGAEVPAITPAEGTGVIRSVTLDETAQGFSLKIVADRPVGRTAFMNLNNPRRLVVDILGKWSHRGGNVLRSEGEVKHVVMGEHPDHFRMVVHFRTPPKKALKPEIRTAGDELHVLVSLP